MTHYECLGIPEHASAEEIRKSYRKLVLKYHPDRSGDVRTTDKFVQITEAYAVLSDAKRRSAYDASLQYRRERERMQKERQRPQQRREPPKAQQRPPGRDPGDLAAKLTQAAVLYSQGRYDAAESVAKLVLRSDPRRAMAHAILGDIARSKQRLNEALGHYSYAIQIEPNNSTFARRYEEVLRLTSKVTQFGDVHPVQPRPKPLFAAAVLSALPMAYVALAREAPVFSNFYPISTWTYGLAVMLFLNGVIAGAALSVGQTVDRWDSAVRGSSGKLSAAAMLGFVAVVNFWASALLYVFLGQIQNSYTYTMSRLITAVGVLAVSYAFMANLSPTIMWQQALLWGGNVIYIGALCGWAVADAFR